MRESIKKTLAVGYIKCSLRNKYLQIYKWLLTQLQIAFFWNHVVIMTSVVKQMTDCMNALITGKAVSINGFNFCFASMSHCTPQVSGFGPSVFLL